MDVLVIILGTVFAAAAVACSFWSAPAVRALALRTSQLKTSELGPVALKVWASLVCGTMAGVAQAWEGNALVALVWAVFVAVQCSNLGTVRAARLASPPQD